MHYLKFFLLIIFCIASCKSIASSLPMVEEETIEAIIEAQNNAISAVVKKYDDEVYRITKLLFEIKENYKQTATPKEQLKFLLLKSELNEALNKLYDSERTEISKIRYIKGLQIIKILYEKTLALDHHFASVNTLSEINKMSNPNQYPEFTAIKELLKSKSGKKVGFDLSAVLGNNLYTSVAHSLISLFNDTSSSKKEKESKLKEVECIIDFTLRMHNDLNTIYFETKFLQKNNDNIIKELHQLFVDFTKPIAYTQPLDVCRDTDDWDNLREKLEKYLLKLDETMQDDSKQRLSRKMQINLEFPIDRLLQFIVQYNTFIDQGAKFYEKFGIMLNSYENETQCSSKVPIEYQTLKENILVATEKFNTAYKPVEINGSKMKEILYGINEYE